MKCLLVDANWQQAEIGPRLALGCLAGAIRGLVEVEGLEFLLTEADLTRISQKPSLFGELELRFLQTVAAKVEKDPGIRVVGVSGWSGSFPRMLRIARRCKAANPDVIVVFGGSHVTLHERHCPPSCSIPQKHSCVDYVIVGEGEKALQQLLGNLIASRFKRYRELHRLSASGDCTVSTRIECKNSKPVDLPRPFWDPFLKNAGGLSRIVFFVETARGCPHRCRFCDEQEIWRPYRRFNVGRVVRNIEKSISLFGSRSFRFADSTLTANPSLGTLCQEIIQRDLEVTWSAFAHCAEITEDKAALLARAGCRCLLVGVESGTQSVLDAMNKGTSRYTIERAVEILRRHCIHVRGSFIIGYPGETVRQALDTISFAKSLSLDACSWHVYQPPFRLAWQQPDTLRVAFAHYELDAPPEVNTQMLTREPGLLSDMHALPLLATYAPWHEPDPSKWLRRRMTLFSVLQRAIAETGEGSRYDLEALIGAERRRRNLAGYPNSEVVESKCR